MRSTRTPVRTSRSCASAYSRRYASRSSRTTQRPKRRGILRPGSPDRSLGVCRRRRSYRSRHAAPGSRPASSTSGSRHSRRNSAAVASPAEPAPTMTRSRRSTAGVIPSRPATPRGEPPLTVKMILVHACKRLIAHNGTMLASALAYSVFFAIPSVLLVVVGVFTLAVGPGTITSLMQRFNHVMPSEATSLLGSSLQRLDAHPAQSVAVTVVGFVLAIWATTGAMTGYMTAINLAYERKDTRSFVRKRLIALEMVGVIGIAVLR